MSLELATLQRITGLDRSGKNAKATPKTDGDAIPVQFNPATLRISRRNNVDRGGVTTGTQKREHPAQENSTLSFDLEFDTAEQGSGGQYVDVRRWTALVRQFVEPPPDKPNNPPPGVRFAWGTLIYDGLIGEIVEELDIFAPDGTPLHAKVSVKIEEQNFQYEANVEGGGSRDAKTATDPGRPPSPTTSGGGEPPPGTAPGSSGTRRPQQIVQAQAGESVQDVLSRTGLDPNAWRAGMQDLDSPLSLPAGTPVQLGAEIFAGAGIGLSAGFAAEPARPRRWRWPQRSAWTFPPGTPWPGRPWPRPGPPTARILARQVWRCRRRAGSAPRPVSWPRPRQAREWPRRAGHSPSRAPPCRTTAQCSRTAPTRAPSATAGRSRCGPGRRPARANLRRPRRRRPGNAAVTLPRRA